MNIPNALTLVRFALVPVFGVFLYTEQYLVAVILFFIGGLTDVLDGYIARKFNMITSWGKLADPAADKLMQLAALIVLTMLGRIPVLIMVIVTAKEVFMGLGSIHLYKKDNHVVSANWYGKLATVIFYFAILIVIFFDLREPYSGILISVAILPTLYAFVRYFMYYREIRGDSR